MDCSEKLECENKNADIVVIFTYTLDNEGFADSPDMQLHLNFYHGPDSEYTHNVTKVTRRIMKYEEGAGNETDDEPIHFMELEANMTSNMTTFIADMMRVPNRSTSVLDIVVEFDFVGKRPNKGNSSLYVDTRVVSSDNSSVLNMHLPRRFDEYNLAKSVDSSKNGEGDDDEDDDDGMSKKGRILVGVFVTIGILLIVGIGVFVYCRYCRKPKATDQPGSYQPSAPPKDSGFNPVNPKDVSMDLSLNA